MKNIIVVHIFESNLLSVEMSLLGGDMSRIVFGMHISKKIK